ncbi:receptor expression-enhancing protein 3 [Felis catus]|nr:receptor expression-enhancing protein 3 [Felis catus]
MMTTPTRKSPASAPGHSLGPCTPGGRPRDVTSREVEVGAQESGPRGFSAPAGVPTALPPEHHRPDPGTTDAPPLPPPPISGVQGRGRLARRQLGRGRGRAGTGGGTDRRAAPAAARIHPARLPRAPARPRGARGAGERAACRWRPGQPRSAPTRPLAGVQDPGKMVSWMISRAVVLVFGMLYPAYYSYKAVKTKNVKEYVRWMMYWIVFALYTVIETITDQTVAWFPLYYELKIAFVIWLLSPYTKGASLIYRKFLHPLLSSKEREIDDYIVQAKERGYETVVNFGRQGLAFAATAAVTAAVKSQGAITERLRSFSMHDLTAIQGDEPVGQRSYQSLQEAKKKSKSVSGESAGYGIPLKDGDEKTDEEAEGPYSDDEMLTHKGLRRSQSMKSVKTVKGRKEVRYGSLKYKVKKRPQVYF